MPSLRARSLMELITVTRATTASYCNSAGLLAQAAAGVARIDFDPVTRVSRGLLVEEARTNLAWPSEDISHANWDKSTHPCTVSSNTTAAPDGNVTMDTVLATATSNRHAANLVPPSTNLTNGLVYAASIWVQRGTTRYACFTEFGGALWHIATFDFDTGTFSDTVNCSANVIESRPDGSYRIEITFTRSNTSAMQLAVGPALTATNASLPSWAAAGTESVKAWGVQLEQGVFATSYIATTTAAAVRNADNIRLTSLSPWLDEEAAGAIVAEYSVPWTYSALDGTTRLIVDISSDSSNRHFIGVAAGKARGQTITGGVVVATDPALVSQPARTVVGRIGWTWAKDSFAFAIDGSISYLDSAGAVPASLTTAQLGAGIGGSVDHLCGHLRRFRFYPRRVSNAELQQLTKAA